MPPPDPGPYAQARQAWLAQAAQPFAVHETHRLRKVPGTAVGFDALCAALARVGDAVRNLAPEARHPCDEQGRSRHGEGFALVDGAGTGLFVRVRESGDDPGPNYSYFHATSVGLDKLVLEADLALVDGLTLAPIRTPDILTVSIRAQRPPQDLQALHALIAREFSRLGYRSDSHPHVAQVDALWKRAHWPSRPGLPLERLLLQLPAGQREPAVTGLLGMLAGLYGRLGDGAAPDPAPVQTDGRPGLGHYFVLLRDAGHGWKFVLDAVDPPEQQPPGCWGISLRSVGLQDLFVASRRVLVLGVDQAPAAMQVASTIELCVTGTDDPVRLQQAVQTLVEASRALGYGLAARESTVAGNHPD